MGAWMRRAASGWGRRPAGGWGRRILVAGALGIGGQGGCEFGSSGASGGGAASVGGVTEGSDGGAVTSGPGDDGPGDGAPTSAADDGVADSGDSTIGDSGTNDEGSTGAPPSVPAPWWDEAWSRRAELRVTETADGPLPDGYSLLLEKLDTMALIDAGVLLPDRSDLRVVWWDGSSSTELSRRLPRSNTPGTTALWWKTQAEIDGETKGEYWLYWNNPEAGKPPDAWADSMSGTSEVYLAGDDFEGHDTGSCPDGWGTCGPQWSIQHVGNSQVLRGISPQIDLLLADFEPTVDVVVHARVRNADPGACPGLVTGANANANADTWLWAGYGCEPPRVPMPGISLQLLEDGKSTTLFGGAAETMGEWRSVAVRWIGTEVTLLQDGMTVGTADAGGATPGGIGFSVENNLPGEFDDVFVRRLVLPEPGVEVGPEELLR